MSSPLGQPTPGPVWGLLAEPSYLAQFDQIFDGALRFRNCPEEVARFPLPFATDRYETRLGLSPHDRQGPTASLHALFDTDSHYHAMIAAKAKVLATDPRRYQSLPHMEPAQWEAMTYIMSHLAQDFPQHFTFERDGAQIRWQNQLLKIDHRFTYGQTDSLPAEPMAYIGRQVQGDFILLDQRDGSLFLDVALVTEAFYWSIDFIFGLDWSALHGPVQGADERRIIEQGRRFAAHLRPGQPVRRINWGTQNRPRLDMSMENRAASLHDSITSIQDDFILRTELQHLHRLEGSNAVLFCLRNYMASLAELAQVPGWGQRLYRVLRDFPMTAERAPSIAHRAEAVAWLAQFEPVPPESGIKP